MGAVLSMPHLEQGGFQKGWETGPPVLGGGVSLAAGEPHPHPSFLLACLVLPSDFVAVRNTQGDFCFKRSLAINSLEKSESRGKRIVLEEVQREALGRQAPALPGGHGRHFQPTARTMEKELRRELEIRCRPSSPLKLN